MAKVISEGTLVGFKSSTFDKKTTLTYSIFSGDEQNQTTGLFQNPQVIKFYAEEPVISSKDLVYGKKLLLEIDIDLSGAKKPRVLSIKAV